jgi:hypothetical protein
MLRKRCPSKGEMRGKQTPPEPGSGPRLRFFDRLRKMTAEAPLPSLTIAFLLGGPGGASVLAFVGQPTSHCISLCQRN